jgi:hypothetical protein
MIKKAKTARKPAFPLLTEKQVAAVMESGRKHPWQTRTERGIDWRANVFAYVADTYRSFIPGLTLAHLRRADLPLYRFLVRKIHLEGRPPGFQVPTAFDARELTETDPGKKAVREYFRTQQRKRRASKTAKKT